MAEQYCRYRRIVIRHELTAAPHHVTNAGPSRPGVHHRLPRCLHPLPGKLGRRNAMWSCEAHSLAQAFCRARSVPPQSIRDIELSRLVGMTRVDILPSVKRLPLSSNHSEPPILGTGGYGDRSLSEVRHPSVRAHHRTTLRSPAQRGDPGGWVTPSILRPCKTARAIFAFTAPRLGNRLSLFRTSCVACIRQPPKSVRHCSVVEF